MGIQRLVIIIIAILLGLILITIILIFLFNIFRQFFPFRVTAPQETVIVTTQPTPLETQTTTLEDVLLSIGTIITINQTNRTGEVILRIKPGEAYTLENALITANTQILNQNNEVTSISSLKPGDNVSVHGKLQNTTILATRVKILEPTIP